MEELEKCPVCSGMAYQLYTICKDYTVSQSLFHIVSCNTCGFAFTNPRPKQDEVGAYYMSENYISHTNNKNGFVDSIYHWIRKITTKQKLSLLNRLQPKKGNLLEIGCGTGTLLNACQKIGWQIEGIEPSSQARAIAEQTCNTKIKDSIEQLLPQKTFDCIMMWHVLEHIHRLNETLIQIKSQLRPGGTLLVAVPNREAADAEEYQEYWAAYDVPRHLYHFRKQDVEVLMAQHQLKIIEILPMPFDSFYVSLLSTHYKYGKNYLLKAFFSGLISNIKAQRKNNYSSLIYVLAHQ